jgi:hypothetical protein
MLDSTLSDKDRLFILLSSSIAEQLADELLPYDLNLRKSGSDSLIFGTKFLISK